MSRTLVHNSLIIQVKKCMDHTISYQVWGLDMEYNNLGIKQMQFNQTSVGKVCVIINQEAAQ